MKKILLFLAGVLAIFGNGYALDYSLVYTLTPTNGSNSAYAGECDITVNGITWTLEGNSQMQPWRLGGKSITDTDRALYSTTPMVDDISQVEMSIDNITATLNSFTFIVSKNADFSSPVYSQNHEVTKNATTTITKPEGQDWSNCYYKFSFNVTCGGSNQFVGFKEAKFYKTDEGDGGGTTDPDPGTDPDPDPEPGDDDATEVTETWSAAAGGFTTGTSSNAPTTPADQTSTATGITYTFYNTVVNSQSYLFLKGGTSKGYISWSLTYPISEIKMTTSSGNSTGTGNKVTVYADDNAIETDLLVNTQSGTYTVAIPDAYQAAGTVFKVLASGTTNTQFTSFTYVKAVETGKAPAGLAFSESTATATIGQLFTAPTLSNPNNLDVTYTSSRENVASIDASGNVEVRNLGVTTITAESAENDDYNAGLATYTLTVVPEDITVLNVQQAIDAIDNGSTANVKVQGYITKITDMSNTGSGSQYGNATYLIADTEDGEPEFTIYRGYWLNGEKFTTGDEIEVGGLVTVKGDLTLYGSTYELGTGNQVVEYNAPVVPEPVYNLLGSYSMFVQPTTLTAEKTEAVATMTYDVYVNEADETDCYMQETGETSFLNGQKVNFSYNEAANTATVTAYYAGELGGENTWLSAFVYNPAPMTEPQETYPFTFDKTTGFAPAADENAGLGWFTTDNASSFDPEDLYSGFYIVNEPVVEPVYNPLGSYSMFVQPTTLTAEKTEAVATMTYDVYVNEADETDCYMQETGETSFLNGQKVNFTYNEAANTATVTAYYAGELGGENTWLSAFVYNPNPMTEPQETYPFTFDKTTGFAPAADENAGLGWFTTDNATEFIPMGLYSGFYIVNEPVEEPTPDEPIEVTFNFTSLTDIQSYNSSIPDFEGWTTDTSTNKYFAVDQLSNEDVTINAQNGTLTGNQAMRVYGTGAGVYTFRFNNGGAAVVAAPAGYKLTKAVWTSNTTASTLKKMTVSGTSGSLVFDNKVATWTANEDAAVSSLTFSANGTQMMNSLVVTIEATDEPVEPDPVNTTPIYLMGSGNGLSWDAFPGMEVKPGEDGTYNFTIENLSSFKMSTKKAAGWDGDFNDEAFGYSGAFGDAVFNTSGMTVALEPWGENQDMPYPGSYTIKINADRTSMTVKANFAKPVAAPDVFVRGAMNGWGGNPGDAWKFENTAWDGNSGTWTWTGTINANQEFKIADPNWGNINYSTNGTITTFNQPLNLIYNQQNSKFAETFVGTITLTVTNYTGHQATATFATEGEASFPETMYVFGNVNGKGISPDNGVAMTVTDQDNGIYTIENVLVGNEMDSGYGYIGFAEKLSDSASDWSTLNAYRFGPATADEPIEATGEYTVTFTDYNSFKVPADTYLTMTLDAKNMTLTVTEMVSQQPEEPTIPEDAYVVYADGTINPDLHFYPWWGATVDYKAANPEGTGEVLKFTADNGVGGSLGWNMEAPQNTGILHEATLNFSYFATGTGKYTIRLTSVNEQNYDINVTAENAGKWNTVALPVTEYFPTVAQQWNENAKLGVGYVFSIILENGADNAAIYFNNVYYTNVDNEWEAPEMKYPFESVPEPTQDPENVLSLLSGKYTPATTFGIGQWGQSTSVTDITFDEQPLEWLQNFNYLGWELAQHINVADYDYLHVDFFPVSENAGFKVTPITGAGGSATEYGVAQTVTPGQWNSYDIALQEWDNLNLADVYQMKFDGGNNSEAYIANVYFWKDENGEEPGDEITYALKGDIFYEAQANNMMPMPLVDGIPTATAIVQPQNFNVVKLSGSEIVETYGPTGAGDITGYAKYPGMVTDNTWVLSADVASISGDKSITFKFNPETLELTIDNPTGVEGVIADAEGETVYYNLQGVRVDNPTTGLYIVVRNGQVTKELVK